MKFLKLFTKLDLMKLVDVLHFKIIQMYGNKNSFTRCLGISLHYIVAIMYIRYIIICMVYGSAMCLYLMSRL